MLEVHSEPLHYVAHPHYWTLQNYNLFHQGYNWLHYQPFVGTGSSGGYHGCTGSLESEQLKYNAKYYIVTMISHFPL